MRIAITGIGIVSPLGIGLEKFWEALVQGKSGVGFISSYETGDFPAKFAAEIKDFNASDFIPRKAIKVMARDIQLACASSKLAVDDANLDGGCVSRDRIGVSLGAGLINADIDELGAVAGHSLDQENRFDMKKFGQDGIRELMPLWLLKQLPNMLSSHVSILHNAQGPGNSITTGCASAILSIGESMRFIRKGMADAVLTGGADSKINPMSILRFYIQKFLAHDWSDPGEAMRPFDKRRNGFVAGECAGTIVIEDFSKARSRGAKIYAEVIGFGAGFSNTICSEDSIIGKIHAMRSAIKNAGIRDADIDLISAHGISLQKEDTEEREAVQRLFGERADRIPVMALKSRTGYPGAASGIAELIGSLMAMKHGIIPHNPNFFERDEGDVLDHIAGAPGKKDINCVMVNAFGIAGQNAVLILRRI